MTPKNTRKKTNRKKNDRHSSRPILLLVFLGSLLLLSAGYLLFSKEEIDPNYVPDVTGGPSLKADKEQIDFGDIPFNQVVTATFTLTNVGDRTLSFTEEPYIEIKDGC